MKKSYSKIKHTQEANLRLEKRFLSESYKSMSTLIREQGMEVLPGDEQISTTQTTTVFQKSGNTTNTQTMSGNTSTTQTTTIPASGGTVTERFRKRFSYINEEGEFPLKDTVISSGAFDEEHIPAECMGENSAGMSQVDMISGCIGKVTEKSSILNKTIQALNDLLNKTKTEADSLKTESRKYRKR